MARLTELALTVLAVATVLSAAPSAGQAPLPVQPRVPRAVPAAPAAPAAAAAEVKLRDDVVFKLVRERRHTSAQARARAAARALEHALIGPAGEVRVVAQNEGRAIFAGNVPIVELYVEDALSAGESLEVYTGRIATRIRESLEAERRRSDLAQTVFSISLVVFFGLIALYLLRRIGELAERAREFAVQNPDRIAAVRISSVEVIGAGPLRAGLLAALIVGRWALSIGVVYFWLVLSLSQFEVTKPYTSRLTGSLFTPFSGLAQRTFSALPLLLLLLIYAVGVYVVVRFVELFFVGVTRGEARAHWLPRELIEPTSLLIRVALVVLAVIFAGPIVTGDPDSVLARAGTVLLLAVAIAITPLLASVTLGTVLVFSRRIRIGRQVEVGGQHGRVTAVGLLDVQLRDAEGREVRVPHVLSLLRPSRIEHDDSRIRVELCVSSQVALDQVKELLEGAAASFGDSVKVELREIDADGARYQVSLIARHAKTASDLRLGLAQVLLREGIAWGRQRAGRASS